MDTNPRKTQPPAISTAISNAIATECHRHRMPSPPNAIAGTTKRRFLERLTITNPQDSDARLKTTLA
jgi:hypothetical protein